MKRSTFNQLTEASHSFDPNTVANKTLKVAMHLMSGMIDDTDAKNLIHILNSQAKWLKLEGFLDDELPNLKPMED